MSIKKRLKVSKTNKRAFKWVFYILVYTTFMGILYGTVKYHFGDTHLFWGLVMSWEMFFLTLGGFGWVLITLIIFKGRKPGDWK
ncbi:hypothetical protein LCGC14_0597100 [marine sediment metagenome]|uniref:2TM domain-containing protein n=1 Tax=marine sediment metagenome TaxID=412755 RepID=A0A0F9RVF5_9ZZZZ